MADIVTILGALGGFELIKWLANFIVNRRNNARVDSARADVEEFRALREYNEWLQNQLSEKEKNYQSQINEYRTLNREVIDLEKSNSDLKVELAIKRCEVKKCPNREPQNGY